MYHGGSMEQTAFDGKILELEKFRLIRKLRASGLEYVEDQQGKFRIWLRLSADGQPEPKPETK